MEMKPLRTGIYGAPVPCVSLPTLECCVYGQGPFLRRLSTMKTLNHRRGSDESSLLVLDQGSIHGIRYSTRLSFVFGGRFVAFLHDVRDMKTPMRVVPVRQQQVPSNYLTLSDWIWDCQAIEVDRDKNYHDTSLQLLMGMAFNTVQVWTVVFRDGDAVQAQIQRIVRGMERSISYCVCLHGASGQVAVGTVSNEILVWSFLDSDNTEKKPVDDSVSHDDEISKSCHHLTGHKGVLHAVCFDSTATRLVSTSDDRSVRLWEKFSNTWQPRWTAWGHSARGYAVAFSSVGVISTGEDSTARLWDTVTGASLSVMRCHTYQWIRSVDSLDGWAAIGANNGTVAMYNLADRVVRSRSLTEFSEEVNSSSSWTATFPVPSDRDEEQISDRAADKNVLSDLPKPMKKRQRKKPKLQVVVGMEFCDPAMGLGDPSCLLVVTRKGSVMILDSRDGKWTQQKPWRSATSEAPNLDGCCLKLHPRHTIASIGTTSGDIVIVDISSRRDSSEVARRTVLPARQHRSVQRLQWLSDAILLSFHVNAIVMWTFLSANNLCSGSFDECGYHAVVMRAEGSKGTTSCSAFNMRKEWLVVGDTRGNLSLFDLRGAQSSLSLSPKSFQRCAHGKEHVNSVVWDGNEKIVSVGNDGCLVESLVDKEGYIRSVLSLAVGAFTGVTHILYSEDRCCSTQFVVGGYIGNTFAIVDSVSGYEYVSLETGGRQRLLSVCDRCVENDLRRACRLAVCESRKDGGCAMLVAVFGEHGSLEHRYRDNQLVEPAFSSSTGVVLHGESVLDVCLFPIDLNGRRLALITGSEDCSSKIAVYENGRLTNSKQLPSQSSGVRAVCSSRAGPGTTLVVVGGGKGTTQFFVVSDLSSECDNNSFPLVRFIGNGNTTERIVLDQRVNALKAIAVSAGSSDKVHIVVSGNSAGTVSVFRMSEQSDEGPTGYTFFRSERPILSLELTKHDHLLPSILLLVGLTDGSVLLFRLPETTYAQSECFEPMLSLANHAVGTNAIAGRWIASENDFPVLRVCSVGDDQRVTCCDLHLLSATDGRLKPPKVARRCSKREASQSALKGVAWVNDESFVTAGYDQRLAMWSWSIQDDSIALLSHSLIGVGDVNSLTGYSFETSCSFAVGGAGVELFTMDIPSFEF
jgi:WD40 repeat protein